MVTKVALNLLDAVETIEMRSLSWGYSEGSLSTTDLMALGPPSVVDELIDAQLLIELPNGVGETRYRSRFAEMVRLMARLRQLFPGKPWIGAPRLVSDFRIDRRPRRYPKRDLAPNDIAAKNIDSISATQLRRDVWQSLTGGVPGLAAFQERATTRLLSAPPDSGTIVTAGTGSGKTMAFYLPALMRIAEAIDDWYWTKAIAVYPRIELLKDQFAEAYRMARRLDLVLSRQGKRKIKIGAFFGSTPNSIQQPYFSDDWRETRAGRICPWLRCPNCDGELAWRNVDLANRIERLSCLQPGCSKVIGPDEVVLTRQSLKEGPPDILFTTSEMLNQRLSDHWYRGLFGVGVPNQRKPFIALLDEIHTYGGTSGAQVALVLRRWRHAVDAPIIWAGLSATLAEARRFFAELTGVQEERVEEVSPQSSEMEYEGAEYQIILQGDPGTRASLLSTSIQTAMLVSRTLDPANNGCSAGTFGRRLFVFTDDLDVTNRLFDDLRDAEAYNPFGRPDPTRQPLAALRAATPDSAVRDRDGQRWRMCEQVGHDLRVPLVIGRTTSQDAGVNTRANVIVATAALEVGFNDPHVGAVLQHKAPRNSASFLQRKGRAGRDRAMRPLTVTVLSDYGRDRICFQTYEHLFDPELPPQRLPIGNQYVLKMQAVFAFFDWISVRSVQITNHKGWMWRMLSGPKQFTEAQALAEATKKILDGLMIGDSALIGQLRQHLKRALRVDDAVVEGLLWDPPRSLILEAIPTLNRRVTKEWRLAFPKGQSALDICVSNHPLPDFVPRALFSDLNLPEVTVVIPPDGQHESRRESLPIVQALGQLVPGRVTRRFAFERGKLCHWVPVASLEPRQIMRVDEYAAESEFIGTFTPRCNNPRDSIPRSVFRPWTVELRTVQRNEALPSSNARLNWDSEFVAHGEPLVVPPPPRSRWSDLIGSTAFHVHRFRGGVTVRRFASSADANIRKARADYPTHIEFVNEAGEAAALGFAMDVDGMRLDLNLPGFEEFAALSLPADLAASARASYLRSRFLGDNQLPDDLNVFQRDWLIQITMSIVLSRAVQKGCSATVAATEILSEGQIVPEFCAGMADIFSADTPALNQDEEDEDDDGEEPARRVSRLEEALTAQIARPEVQARLRSLASEFDAPDQLAFGKWLRDTVAETLGEALLQACLATAPRQATIDTLLLDFESLETGGIRLWITEATPGGAGVLHAFAERFASEPSLLFSALEAALAPTDLEIVAAGLERVVNLATSDVYIAATISDVRAAVGHEEREKAWGIFRREMARRGLPTGHGLSVALNSRLIRVGSGPELDNLLSLLLNRWKEIEGELGLSVGLREFACIVAKDKHLTEPLRTFLLTHIPDASGAGSEQIALVSGLLWPRGSEIRQRVLQSYNPFRRSRFTDSGLARAVLMAGLAPEVRVEDEDWRNLVANYLARHGTVRLSSIKSPSTALQAALIELAATPIDVAYLQFFATLDRFEDDGERLAAILTLRERV